ncbi:MAG: alpha/beta hydrolase [Candidatus Nomurabacteria bacterium]|jgi:pimeloyl-ACP methyl ester carboxylesterase|nr:alpha/beta hydrolase [Candidatus Nomurabacteria bacterium]
MKVVVDGLMTNYTDVGQGPVLLILHGWGSSAGMWQRFADYLAKDYRIIALDLPGFGATDEPKTAWKIEDYADFVKKFLTKVTTKQLRGILGHSFGGRVVVDMLDSGWKGADKVIFMDSAGVRHRESRSWRTLAAHRLFGWARKIKPVREFAVQHFGSDDYRAATPMMREMLKLAVSEDKSVQIARIRAEVLVIWGANDITTPLTDLEVFRKIKDAQIEVLKGVGHSAYLEKPEQISQLVRGFLR